MKSVLIICLLSLSVCLAEQTDSKVGTQQQQVPANSTPIQDKTQDKEEKIGKSSNETATETVVSKQSDNKTIENATFIKKNESKIENTTAQSKINETTPAENVPDQTKINTASNKIDNQQNDTKVTDGKNDVPKLPEIPNKAVNMTTVDDKDSKSKNTTTNEIIKATEAPVVQARGFDGPSFIGGIILTLGLLVISFIGYKYYKNQTERNYYGTL